MSDRGLDTLHGKNEEECDPASDLGLRAGRVFNGSYFGECLEHIAFPLGGLGAGMLCLDGNGGLSNVSLRHRPNLIGNHRVFAALSCPGSSAAARIVEGPVPRRYLRPEYVSERTTPHGSWGFPRFRSAIFDARFPFAHVSLTDNDLPLTAEIVGWSPFTPPDHDSSSLPACALEYTFKNETVLPVSAMFSFHAENFLAWRKAWGWDVRDVPSSQQCTDRILSTNNGFILSESPTEEEPWREGQFMAWVDGEDVCVDHSWLRADNQTQIEMLWNDIKTGRMRKRPADAAQSSPGASLWVPMNLGPGESRTIILRFAWYVPQSDLSEPSVNMADGATEPLAQQRPRYSPWYATQFASVEAVRRHWDDNYGRLREKSEAFSRCFYSSTLAPEVVEAVAANLTALKSPTILRQADGRLWGWEGSCEDQGAGYGSSNHVWNYAQALPHLFPALERSLRETELRENLGRDGYQAIRAALPIRGVGNAREDAWGFPSAADGQLGCLLKLYRDWRISGDTKWLHRLWPNAKTCLDYCIRTWDPQHAGRIEEPHVTTYDREFWGTDSLCMSLYVGALKAGVLMGRAVGELVDVYEELQCLAEAQLERLFNGEYFIQDMDLERLRTRFPSEDHDLLGFMQRFPEFADLAFRQGPPYQYHEGCLSDGVFGAWLAEVCGVGEIMDRSKARNHLLAVHRYNLKTAREIPSSMRPIFASDEESGLVVCSWPRGGRPSIPLIFCDLVWTGIEYQVASHLMRLGQVEEGLGIVRCVRKRYEGRQRNPFAEMEAGHWYARAMSSYSLLQALSGARYDAIDKTIYIEPAIAGDFKCFLATATGFGTVGVKGGMPIIEVVSGEIPYRHVAYRPFTAT